MTHVTMRRKLSVSFHNFWSGFEPRTSYFYRALDERFDVHVENLGADIEFYSVNSSIFPDEVLTSNALKVWFTGEAQEPRHLIYDLQFNYWANHLLGARSIRLPLWPIYIDWWGNEGPMAIGNLVKQRVFQRRDKFCNFIYSNNVSLRNEIFHRLHKRRRVDSYGGVLNNMGKRAGDKMQVLRDYRFTLACENLYSRGYVTEKLLQPLAAGSIPIYWGAPEALTDFNPAAFINAASFADIDSLIDHVLAMDEDDEALRQMAEAPVFIDGVPYEMTPAHFADRIEEALDSPVMRGVGRQINKSLITKRKLKDRIRVGWRKAIWALRI
jgi:hypothetical protein